MALGSSSHLDWRRLEVYLGHMPSGTSSWTLAHALENAYDGEFAKFDFKSDARNILEYGSVHRPEWSIESITNQFVALVSAVDDQFFTPRQVQQLRNRLRVPLIDDHVILEPGFSHFDFHWGADCGALVNTRIVNILDQFA